MLVTYMTPLSSQLGYIDLSKRRVSQEEIQKCEEMFSRAKTVSNDNSIILIVLLVLLIAGEQHSLQCCSQTGLR